MRLLFTGDSITDSDRLFCGDPLGDGYVRMIQDALPEHEVINRGHNGWTAFQMRGNLDEDIEPYSPDVMTVLVGVNDVCVHRCGGGRYDALEYHRCLSRILKAAPAECRKIVMQPFIFPEPAEYINWYADLEEFGAHSKKAAEEAGAEYIPVWEHFRKLQQVYPVEQLTVDGIHLTRFGHRQLAGLWLEKFNLGWEFHAGGKNAKAFLDKKDE